MIDFVRSLWRLVDPKARRGLWLLAGCLAVGTVLESLGIALFIPLVLFAVDSDKALALPILPSVFETFEIDTPSGRIIFLAGILALMYGLKNAVLAVAIWLQTLIPQKTLAHLSRNLMRAYLKRDYAKHLMQNSSEVLRNFTSSLAILIEHGIRGLMTLVMETVLVIAAVAVTIAVEPVASILVVLTVGITMISVLYFVRRRIGAWSAELQVLSAKQLKEINESLDAFREIKIANLAERRAERLYKIVTDAAPFHARIGFSVQIPRLAGEVAIIVAAFLVIVYLVIGRGLPPESIVVTLGVFGAAAIRILPAASRIIESLANLRRCSVVLNMIKDDLIQDQPTDLLTATTAPPPETLEFLSLRFDSVRYRYPGASKDSLQGVSTTLNNGELICLAGPSGAGKSTFADLILGLIKPSEGSVYADQIDIHENLQKWWPTIGYVPQTVIVTDESLRDNIVFERRGDPRETENVMQACQLAQLTSLVETLPDGIDTRMGERGTWVSGGQRQRVGIARALFGRPQLLVMDEATSSIDGQTAQLIMAEVQRLAGERTVIVIAHNRDIIKACDRIIFLTDGAVIGNGSYQELMSDSAPFQSFMASLSRIDESQKPPQDAMLQEASVAS